MKYYQKCPVCSDKAFLYNKCPEYGDIFNTALISHCNGELYHHGDSLICDNCNAVLSYDREEVLTDLIYEDS